MKSLLALASIVVFLQTLNYAPVYDDVEFIAHNAITHDATAIAKIFTSTYVGGVRADINYRPFTVWSFALNRAFNESLYLPSMHPVSFHLVNIVLHLLVVLTGFAFLKRLGIAERTAFWIMLLFAVLPIHTEAVTGIVGRAELFAALFGLLFLVGHLASWHPAVLGALFLLSVFGKESGLVFPLIAVSIDLVRSRSRISLGFFKNPRYGYYLAAMWVWFVFREVAVWHQPYILSFVDNPAYPQQLHHRWFTGFKYQVLYVARMLFPIHLSSDNSYNAIPMVFSFWSPYVWGFLAVVGALGTYAWRQRRAAPHWLIFCAMYVLLFLLSANILRPIGTTLAERLAYSPSLPLLALVVTGLTQAVGRHRRWLEGALCVLALVYAARTVDRNRSWKDEMTFFAQQVRDVPRSAKAHYNYGTILAKAGRDSEAVGEYERAIEIFFAYPEPYYNLANSLTRLHADPQRVIDAYKKALLYDPFHQGARGNLLITYLDAKRLEEADAAARELSSINPIHPALQQYQLRRKR